MKHLLIILSILLLSSPLFGQETGVLYLWDTSSGQVWKTFRDKDTQPNIKDKLKMGNQMVKKHTLSMMEENMLGIG